MSAPDHKPDESMPRWLAGWTASSGGLLAICLFLPAVEVCNKPMYPTEMPMAWPPYVFGLMTAIAVMFSGKVTRVAHLVSLAGVLLMTGIMMHGMAFDHPLTARKAAALAVFWPLALLAIRAYWPGRAPSARVARATGGGGALSLAWFGSILLYDEHALLGLWLSMLASAMLLLAGVGQEIWLVRQRVRRRRVERPTVF